MSEEQKPYEESSVGKSLGIGKAAVVAVVLIGYGVYMYMGSEAAAEGYKS